MLHIDNSPAEHPDFAPLKRGSRGSDVEAHQYELNEHFDAGLETDGEFGPQTEAAVKQVEAVFGTAVDRVVNADLWNALLTIHGLRQDITPTSCTKKDYMSFTIDMKEIPTRWTHEGGWPTGGILHFTAGRDHPRDTVEYLGRVGYPCLVIGGDGRVYQEFPSSQGGYHCGTSHARHCFGLEAVSVVDAPP